MPFRGFYFSVGPGLVPFLRLGFIGVLLPFLIDGLIGLACLLVRERALKWK